MRPEDNNPNKLPSAGEQEAAAASAAPLK